MAVRIVNVPGIGQISLYKRKGVRTVKMSITHDGEIRVTLPAWAPYRLGVEFVRNKSEWIQEKKVPKRIMEDGDRVGKAHRFSLEYKRTEEVSSRITGTDIRLRVPQNLASGHPSVQLAMEKAALRALKKEAEQLLPMRLHTLAQQYDFTYNSVSVKKLKSRWGSCNERKDIVFNIFLMQLPWHLIDYVILHELTHTKVLRHGQPFWTELSKYVSNLSVIRKEMKSYQPALLTTPGITMSGGAETPREVAIETV